MWMFLSVVVGVGGLTWWWSRVEREALALCRRFLVRPVEEPSAPIASEKPDAMPPHLVAVAMQEEEAWAQQDTLKAMQELYEVTHDWGVVSTIHEKRMRR